MKANVLIDIDVAPDDAFAYIADLSNNPAWQSGVVETRWTTAPPIGVDSKCEQELDDGTVVGYAVTNLEPGKSIAIKTEFGAAMPASVTRTVSELNPTRSRVTMDLVGRVRGWRVILTPLIRRAIESSIRSDYKRLKRVLEPEEPAED